jgi:glutamate synthase domain-containing protein 2
MYTIENSKSTTGTKTRVPDVCPVSGMCPICTEDCNVICEVAKGAFRGRETLYPAPEHFGKSTAASNKDYFLDWSHFQLMAELIGAKGIEPNPDIAFFENVDIRTKVGSQGKHPIDMSIPFHIAGLGSTAVAKRNWKELAVGSALSGVCEVIGENVCGMDHDAVYSNGKVQSSPDMQFRVKSYMDQWDGKNGRIVIQSNVEDQRGGAVEYCMSKLDVEVVERKWGQGAKAIGGEVRLTTLERALELKSRGYIVMPDPEDPAVQAAFKAGAFKTFERHSRVGFPTYTGFVEDIEQLRENGAKNVFLKTGAYKPEVVAFTMKCASDAKIDLLTFDAAGGGTGMSPNMHMAELSSPGIWLFSQVMACAKELKLQGRYVPDLAFAGGFVNESQAYKAFALSDLGEGPLVKSIAMARAPITAAMKGKHFSELAAQGKLPTAFAEQYGSKPEQFFIANAEIQKIRPSAELGTDIPWGAVGLYTYMHDRLGEGLKQLMAGTRKFKLGCIENEDIVALSEYASKVTGVETLDARAARVMKALL